LVKCDCQNFFTFNLFHFFTFLWQFICNMQKVLTAEEMREVDRQTTEKYGIPSILLMENAAHAAARIITEKLGGSVAGKSFLILCGKGNNGGDGASLARILWTQGANVQINLLGKIEDTKGDARKNFEICKQIYEKTNNNYRLWFFEYHGKKWANEIGSGGGRIVIDALFGTGLSKGIKGQFVELVEKVNLYKSHQSNTPYFKLQLLISLDIPSGLNANICEQIGENIQAHLTITFTAPKLANVFPPASNFNGELVVANIGSPPELIDNSPSKLFLAESEDAQKWLNQTNYTSDSYKNKRGHALLVVGSKEYTGAAVLAGNAAMLSGVGLTTIATSESARTTIAAKVLEEIITRALPETKSGAISAKAFQTVEKLFEKVDVVGIGCGLNSSEKTTKDFVREVVEKRRTPVIIDADGLNALSPFDLQGSNELPLILTPHEGEFLRLLGTTDKEILKDRIKAVRDFAEKHNVILVLKGERTLIAAPDGRVVINPTGNSGLGKAGNGDTLTGIITGFVAQAVQAKVDIFETVVAAVYISGVAGDIAAEKFGKRSMLASDVRECLGEAFQSITN
jgi:ADP-dependent NAD(P)H-hydrate dehydratase / NAD(P)H-hydrate epimerase